ncbi:MAG: chloride channel protein [Deltaproteobacteria bacterium GWC2_65_14]|nr:MAG: chloride channel protein [Deltaproteobacteria bacterium GWC2_65_14]
MGRSAIDWVHQATAKWPRQFRLTLLSVAVGVVAGIGAILFDQLLGYSLHLLQMITGYAEPGRGSPASLAREITGRHSYWFLLIPALGGLASGILVYRFAPEAEGHGTDAMIDAFHQRGGFIRRRVPIVKIIASVLTIGSGGSAGKEGPIAQIGSGFGSFLSTTFRLKAREQRILVLAGAAGGIGAIFQAPLGAALFAPEVLYRETEFEYEAILPCIISSIIAHSVYSEVHGRRALFFPGTVEFMLTSELVPYALFGVLCALVGYLYIKVFYGLRDRFFRPLRMNRMLKPALGGLMMGILSFASPAVLNGGYGWVQMALEGKIFWGTMLLLALLKIVATSCTISSGGSGGVFGPSVFIGAMLGGAFGFLGHQVAPGWVLHPNSFVLVGMGGFFAGVAKVPIASIIMACEMSSSYTLLVPLMVVSSISYMLLRGVSLYEKQLISRLASPAHVTEFSRGLLETFLVREAVRMREVFRIPEEMPFGQLIRTMGNSQEIYYPVVNREGHMTGILSINDVREYMFEESIGHLVVARDVATPNVERAYWNETLQQALDKMAAINVDELPVVHKETPHEIVTMITKRDIINYYYKKGGG